MIVSIKLRRQNQSAVAIEKRQRKNMQVMQMGEARALERNQQVIILKNHDLTKYVVRTMRVEYLE